ncbi:hypothetical protein CCACVL1_18906 [Corchorus capsularis]|uniref:Uncharacterized protein n=1 Tax=Corchorus capsularis TaxID=210143 RepID=A0A1R3HJH6_COCAP|nr:hypothetical protein CCACVL1_18906 [Corchorus capsularis]
MAAGFSVLVKTGSRRRIKLLLKVNL